MNAPRRSENLAEPWVLYWLKIVLLYDLKVSQARGIAPCVVPAWFQLQERIIWKSQSAFEDQSNISTILLPPSELDEDISDGIASVVGETVCEQYQKTQVQSSELRPYLARLRFNLASLRRFRIN